MGNIGKVTTITQLPQLVTQSQTKKKEYENLQKLLLVSQNAEFHDINGNGKFDDGDFLIFNDGIKTRYCYNTTPKSTNTTIERKIGHLGSTKGQYVNPNKFLEIEIQNGNTTETRETTSEKLAQEGEWYITIKPGDCLSKIAKKYGMTVKELMELNGLQSDLIKAGEKLKIRGNAYVAENRSISALAQTISDNYEIDGKPILNPAEIIIEFNGLQEGKNGEYVKPGQTIILPPNMKPRQKKNKTKHEFTLKINPKQKEQKQTLTVLPADQNGTLYNGQPLTTYNIPLTQIEKSREDKYIKIDHTPRISVEQRNKSNKRKAELSSDDPYQMQENIGINSEGARQEDLILAKYAESIPEMLGNTNGYCYTATKYTLWNAGIIDDYADMPKGEANKAVGYFNAHPDKFKKLNVAKEDLKSLPAGRIIVYTKDGLPGHIEITNGYGQGMSDHTSNLGWLNKHGEGTDFYVYELTEGWKYNEETKKLEFHGVPEQNNSDPTETVYPKTEIAKEKQNDLPRTIAFKK